MADYTLSVEAGLFCNVEAESEEDARAAAADFFTAAFERGFTVLGAHPGDSGPMELGRVNDLRVYANSPDAEPAIEDVYERED